LLETFMDLIRITWMKLQEKIMKKSTLL